MIYFFFLAPWWYASKFFNPNYIEEVIIYENAGFLAACRIKVGLVVVSSGWYCSMRLKSPVSATTMLCAFNDYN